MTTLRSKLIRLAHENPALRPQLLPLLKEAVDMSPNRVIQKDAEDLRDLIESKIKHPVVKAFVRSLGGDPSVTGVLGFEPKESWTNGILENSKHAKFMFHFSDMTLQIVSSYKTEKMRKTKFKDPQDGLAKLDKWVKSQS